MSSGRNGYPSGGKYDAKEACVQRQVRWVLLPAFLFFSMVHAAIVFGILFRGDVCLRNGLYSWRAKCMQGM